MTQTNIKLVSEADLFNLPAEPIQQHELINWFNSLASAPEVGEAVVTKNLTWVDKGTHHLWMTEGNEFASIHSLEHTVGDAGFEVYQRSGGDWVCVFWHGNRGHMTYDYKSKEEAKNAAQDKVNALVSSLTTPQPDHTAELEADNKRLEAVANEYNDWIIYHDSGNGDFVAFLKERGVL